MSECGTPIYTLDLETDPFKHGRIPAVFCAGLYDGQRFSYSWGPGCVARMMEKIRALEPGIIFMHNGGKFDLYYMMDYIARERVMTIINNRIVRCDIQLDSGKFMQVRDSYALMPFALSKYKKDEIDYSIFEVDMREANKSEIVSYLKGDCVYLHELCIEFIRRFELHLTIGSTSMDEFRKDYEVERMDVSWDDTFRSKFYFGGRVQCFKKGVLHSKLGWKVYDINQCYPYAMREFDHPTGNVRFVGNEITDATFFVKVIGTNKGAFPLREDDGINFTSKHGEYCVSIHEYKAAIELGLFKTDEIVRTYDFVSWGRFDAFVDKFHKLRKDAQLTGDIIGALFFKYIGNSCYGKFAQSPDNYYDYMITSHGIDLADKGYESTKCSDSFIMWRKPSKNTTRFNVATGASITGAARSVLMRGLAAAKRPIYCDTDSIICEGLDCMIDDTRIGAWKLEQHGDSISIAGKKMYALMQGNECTKLASKGVKLSADQIHAVASGKMVRYLKDSPTFDLGSLSTTFITRNVRMT